jgi:O-methyltransferase
MTIENLYQAVADYTLLDAERIFSLCALVEGINQHGVTGDVVECGCCKGGSGAVLRAGMGPNRKLWLFDGFQGLPGTNEADGEEAKQWVGQCLASPNDVVEILATTGATPQEYVIREGWFQDTFRQELPETVALLHCDADWYDSVMLVLDTFYPRMPAGACVILDDFGYWEGTRVAFYDFCEKHGERPLLERAGYTQAFWIKGKTHNRNR